MRSVILASLGLASLGLPARSVAQTAQPDVIAGTIVGRDQPIYAARIRLVGDSGRVVAETASNAWGRFKLAAVPSGRYRLEVRRMGFLHRQIELAVDSTRHDALRVDLEPYVSDCADSSAPAVLMEVREEKTGINLVQGARLEITAADGRTATDEISATDSMRVGPLAAGGDWPGTYRVVVSRPGYKSWTKDNVVVGSGICGVRTVFLRAQLKRDTRTLVAQSGDR